MLSRRTRIQGRESAERMKKMAGTVRMWITGGSMCRWFLLVLTCLIIGGVVLSAHLVETSSNGWARVVQLEEELGMLKSKIHAYLSWDRDPFAQSTVRAHCSHLSDLKEYSCPAGVEEKNCLGDFDHPICVDFFSLPHKPNGKACLVYDFGIREQPHFGETLSNSPFHCTVHAFDPSPVSVKWWEKPSNPLKANQNYHFHPYGAGRRDGTVTLNEYNWGQVSIIRNPWFLNKSHCWSNKHNSGCLKVDPGPTTKTFELPVRTMGSIMDELGHDHVDVLKIDVEGSEYGFLEQLIEDGDRCTRIDQLTVEWHHYDFDSRYGGGASPVIAVFDEMLSKRCGLELAYVLNKNGGAMAGDQIYIDQDIKLRYNLATYVRNVTRKVTKQ